MSEVISKRPAGFAVAPNLADYDSVRARSSWGEARRGLDGLPGGRGLNIAHEAVDRHAAGSPRDKVAIRWLGLDGSARDFTFGDLARASNPEVAEWKKRDPVATFTARLKADRLLDEAELAAIEKDVGTEIDWAVAAAEDGAFEPIEHLARDVYTRAPS